MLVGIQMDGQAFRGKLAELQGELEFSVEGEGLEQYLTTPIHRVHRRLHERLIIPEEYYAVLK
jgi:hypothetical protein